VLAETHPEIRNLERRIASLEGLVAGPGGAAAAGEGAEGEAAASPRSRQVELLDQQIALLERQRAELDERRREIEAALRRAPLVETDLIELERRRENLLEQYDAVVAKRAEAETGERLELGQQGERFEVIENAVPPEGPIAPSRKKILVMGAGASMGVALGFAVLLEMLNPAIRSSAQFQRQLSLAPLAAIPHVRTRSERWRRAAVLSAAALFVIAAVPAGLWAIDTHIRPIQSIMASVADRTGIDEVMRLVRTRL